MKCVPVQKAVGLILCHDITEIVPGGHKGPAFRRGHIVREQDVEHLLRLGKEHLYVWEDDNGMVHEDDAALRIAKTIAGPGVSYGEPKEGRINFTATRTGLLRVDTELLERVNSIPNVTIATLHGMQGVLAGRALAGTRVIPLAVPESTVTAVEECCKNQRILSVQAFDAHAVGVVTTGSEVYHGRIKDAFGPVLQEKFAALGVPIVSRAVVPDETAQTITAIHDALVQGATLVLVTGGMSVDPDDKTPAAVRMVASEVICYGAPVFPGAMFMLAYKGTIPILGLPGCVMYHKASIFDALLPRLLTGTRITQRDIIRLAHGGFCENCPQCHYPVCAFGKAGG